MILISPHFFIIIFHFIVLTTKFIKYNLKLRIVYSCFVSLVAILSMLILISSEFVKGQISLMSGFNYNNNVQEVKIITRVLEEFLTFKTISVNTIQVLILISALIYNLYVYVKYKKYQFLVLINLIMYISVFTGIGQFEFSKGRIGWCAITTSILLLIIHLSELNSKEETYTS